MYTLLAITIAQYYWEIFVLRGGVKVEVLDIDIGTELKDQSTTAAQQPPKVHNN